MERRWQLLRTDTILSTPWISVDKNQYKITNDVIVDDYYIVKRSDFVIVVAIKEGKLLLVRQYRPATDRFYLALPAGYINKEESPEEGAKRELFEETGYMAANCNLIGELHPLPGYVRSVAYVVTCEAQLSEQVLDIDEVDKLEIETVTEYEWNDVIQMIVNGEINEMQAVSAILLAKERMQA